MAGNVSDFMKLWTQSDQASERRLQKFLLVGLDKVVQGQSDVLSKIPIGTAATGPVVRWMEEWGYPSQVTSNAFRKHSDVFRSSFRPSHRRGIRKESDSNGHNPGATLRWSPGKSFIC